MITSLATRLTSFLVAKELIEPRLQAIFRYKLERMLRTFCFGIVVILFAIVSNKYLEVACFTMTAYFFRRRMGGWHSNNPHLCFLLSVGVVVLNALLVGPLIERISTKAIFIIATGLNLVSFFLHPAYPSQLHLNSKEICANINRKNLLLIVITSIQFVCYLWNYIEVVLYTFLGLGFTVVTVVLKNFIIRKDKNHERSKDNCQKSHNAVD